MRLLSTIVARALWLSVLLAAPCMAGADTSPLSQNAIRGVVIDADTGQPVPLANITIAGSDYWTATDDAGEFDLSKLADGVYVLRVTHVGYYRLDVSDLRVAPNHGARVRVALRPRAIRLQEVVVTPGAFSFMESAPATRQMMTREDIQFVPQLGEDVFRAVNRLPGLSSGDYSAHFSIRGGRHDETLILLDGLEVYEPYHLKDFDEGAISIFDVEAIEGLTLMTGGFPARYGNKRSGVLSMTSRRAARDSARYSLGLSLMNARARAEGGYGNGRGSWLVSGRSGWMDLVFALIKKNDLPSPRYHDVFAKTSYKLAPSHTISFDALHAGDTYTFDASGTTGFLDSLDTREYANNRYGNSYFWTSLNSSLGSRTTAETIASVGRVTRHRDGGEEYLTRSDPLYSVVNDRNVTILGLKQDWVREQVDSWVIDAGFDLRSFVMDWSMRSEVGPDPNHPGADTLGLYPVTTSSELQRRGTHLAAYVSNRIRLIDPLILEAGYRYDRASYTGDSDFSPRVTAMWSLRGGRTLRLGWGEYRQVQGIEDVAFLNNDGRYFRSEVSRQWTLGFEQSLANGATLRIEGYHKKGHRLRPSYRNWKGGVDTFPESNEDRILVYPESSVSKGLEIYYDQRLSDRFSIRGSYALSQFEERVSAIENINDPTPLAFDRIHPGPQDQRHAVNVDGTYKLGDAWSINSSFTFHSGWPSTEEALVEVVDEKGETDLAIVPGKIYGSRLPSYQRLDVRATRTWDTRGGHVRAFLEVVNLTNHSNVWGYDYWRDRTGGEGVRLVKDVEEWFTLLPSIGVSWTGDF